jgi:hypothetical protein
MGGLAAAVAALSLFFAHGMFSVAFGLAMALAMGLAATFLGQGWNDLLLRVIGLTSMIYVPYDIYRDTIARSSLLSDARMLAREFGGATMLWGAAWFVASLALICSTLFFSVKSAADSQDGMGSSLH